MPGKAARNARGKAPKYPAAPGPGQTRVALSRDSAPPLAGRIRWDWIAAAFSMLLLAWLVTEGDWNFFPQGGFLETFYDAQAQSLLHGRIDVPQEAIGPEAFMRNGKAYGYFGPTPALARLPLELLLPGMYGRWNCVSMLLASALVIGMLLLLMNRLEARFPPAGRQRLRYPLRACLILATALGSTNLFVSAERKIYQESIVWGSALAFAQAVLLACYLLNPKAKWLALSCAAALLAFFARVSSGAGPLFSLLLVDLVLLVLSVRFRSFWSEAPLPRRAAVTLSATLVAAAALWVGLNHWKYGVWFTSQPIAMNRQFSQERLRRVKGEIVSFYNLPITLAAYLSPSNIVFNGNFPWVFLTGGNSTAAARFSKAHFDSFEPFASLPATMPELFLAALAGTALCLTRRKELRAFRAPLAGAMAGCALIFVFGYVTFRYLDDMLPWLVLGSAIAIAWVASIPGKWLRHALAALFAAATIYAMWVNFALAVRWQRYSSYPIRPEKRVAFTDLCTIVDVGGLKGFLWYERLWHRYIPAASFEEGNLLIDRTDMVERGDQPVVRSQGQPPYGAEYIVDLPANGTYEIAVRYAAAEPLPVHLLVNGRDMKEVCRTATGGWRRQTWESAGLFHLSGGANRIALASYGAVPPVSMLRLIRIE